MKAGNGRKVRKESAIQLQEEENDDDDEEEESDSRRTTRRRMIQGEQRRREWLATSALRTRRWLARSKRTKKRTTVEARKRLRPFWCRGVSGDEVASTRSLLGAVTRKAVNAFILIGARSRPAGNSVAEPAKTRVPLLLLPLHLLLIPVG